MDWILSGISIVMLWLMGDGSIWSPIVGLVGQIFWIYYVITTQQYGLLPGVSSFAIVHMRNLYKFWKKEMNNKKRKAFQPEKPKTRPRTGPPEPPLASVHTDRCDCPECIDKNYKVEIVFNDVTIVDGEIVDTEIAYVTFTPRNRS